METYKKKQLISMIAMLEKVNGIMENIYGMNPADLQETLVNCQQIAIEIGNCLEEKGEAWSSVIEILEQYCENLYQQSLSLNNQNQCSQLAEVIRNQLLHIRDAIQNGMPDDRKEIVFLPYSPAMWDSLESVWKAAEADESCDAYVIPIPYFDKNADGTFGAIHDRSDEYPEDVPITSWKEYSIPNRRPDVIYIHNPYDNWNNVLSVHSDYYASELKNHTDMLVYIPYFVGIDDRVREPFCVLPAVRYADKVIVESENVRDIYIKTVRRFEEDENCVGRYGNIEEKVLALGSPKFDRVRSLRKEDMEIPAEWNRLLMTADGNKKKVIFYNTTVDALINHKSRALDKIEEVLELFRNRKDVLLLWRPHPLYMSTVQRMMPELSDRYQRIVERYQEENQGIYDDTPDMERSIALSDAYYGDLSSVVTLYRETGKPVMITNYEI